LILGSLPLCVSQKTCASCHRSMVSLTATYPAGTVGAADAVAGKESNTAKAKTRNTERFMGMPSCGRGEMHEQSKTN